MFNLNNFVMKTLKGMVGKYPEFQTRQFALNWFAKGVLTEEDLATVESWYAVTEATEEGAENEDSADVPDTE